MIDILNKYLQNIFSLCGYDYEINIIKSNRPDLCDYQCDDVFKLAKLYKQNPIQIGTKIVDFMKEQPDFTDYFKDVSFIQPGFINLILSDKIINQVLNCILNNDNFDLPQVKPETYFLDYGGPNIAKPLHVGHLRTAIIGEAVKRIINFVGHKTISDVHLGDYGLQIGQVIYAVVRDKKAITEISIDYLNKVYPEISKLCKENEEVLAICSKITKDLQDGDKKYQEIWQKISEISLNDIKKIYNYLNITFDLWEGESDAYNYINEVTTLLKTKNLLKESDSAQIIELSPLPPLIYQKSNGAYLYGTTDMATIYERITKYKPNHILYIVDARQKLHFEQVFKACDLWGITDRVILQHLGYGTVNGSDGKPFKTRSGDTVGLSELLQQVKEVFILSKDTNKTMSEKDLDIITNAIVKFADLQNNREKDYIFDIKKFSEVIGKTGPYILYTYLRINKVLSNYDDIRISFNKKIYNDSDRNLRLKILELSTAINNAFSDKLPNYIAEYIYELSCLANAFYQNNYLNDLDNLEIKKQWISLLSLTNNIIKTLLDLLAIDIPSKM